MKRPLKIIAFAFGSLVLLLVVGLVIVAGRLDGIVERVVETEGTKQLSVETLLGDADVSILGGSLTLTDLSIDNPEGYSSDHLFEMGQVSAKVGFAGLTGDPVRIESIDINSPTLTIERGSAGGLAEQLRLNLRDLLANLEMSDEETTLLLIDRLTVTQARVVVLPKIADLDEEYSFTLPNVTLEQIGTADEAQNGAELGRVVGQVAMALASQAAESEDLPPELRAVLSGDLRGVLTDYGNQLGDRLQNEIANELCGDVGDAVGAILDGDTDKAKDAVRKGLGDGIQKGLGDLLGGDDEKADE
ncbi:MAG: AsmA family protein [Planctomycetota bacterium]